MALTSSFPSSITFLNASGEQTEYCAILQDSAHMQPITYHRLTYETSTSYI